MRIAPAVSMHQHVFVVGVGRSGTTLMQVLLGAHPVFGTCAAETGIFTWQDLCDLERHIGQLMDAKIRRALSECRDIVTFFDLIATQVLEEQGGGKRFVEKTPQHLKHLAFLLSHFPQAQIIHMYRDGRDCYCSARTHSSIPHAWNVALHARHWAKCVRIRQALGNHPRILDIRYEALCTDPKIVLKQALDFLGESFNEDMLDSQYRRDDPRSQLDDFRKLGEPIDGSSILRWQSELTASEVVVYERIAGRELRQLGYPVRT